MVNDASILQNVILKCKFTANSRASAFGVAHDLIGEPLEFNKVMSERAGYPIYTCESGSYVCDLEDRLQSICMIMLEPKDYKERFSKDER